jgi:hypothetical protein
MPGECGLSRLIALGIALSGCAPHADPTWPHGKPPPGATAPDVLQLYRALANRHHPRASNFGYHVTLVSDEVRPIGNAAVPFARYLNHMHEKVHPLFADGFLTTADRRSADDPLSNPNLATTVELVLAGTSGRILHLSIVRSSGVTAFDGGVTASLEQAAPFGEAPPEIRSPDGNVHLQWEIRRDAMACSSVGMHPLLLKR